MSDFDLDRFLEAQEGIYSRVVEELSGGRKRSHWMWFIFPQIAGLGFSAMAQRYAIRSRAEAQAYIDHEVLGRRLLECTRLVLQTHGSSINEVLGYPDDVKFRSSMTLFAAVSQQSVFDEAIGKFFAEGRDPATLDLLASC